MNIINTNNINSKLSTSNMFYIKNIIETPYEKVLSIIQETLKSLNLANKVQSKLLPKTLPYGLRRRLLRLHERSCVPG